MVAPINTDTAVAVYALFRSWKSLSSARSRPSVPNAFANCVDGVSRGNAKRQSRRLPVQHLFLHNHAQYGHTAD